MHTAIQMYLAVQRCSGYRMHAEAYTIRCKITLLKSPFSILQALAGDKPVVQLVRSAAVPYQPNGEPLRGPLQGPLVPQEVEFEFNRNFFETLSDEVIIVEQRPARVCCCASFYNPPCWWSHFEVPSGKKWTDIPRTFFVTLQHFDLLKEDQKWNLYS